MGSFEHWLTRQWLHRGVWAHLMWPLHRLMRWAVERRRQSSLDHPERATRLPCPVIVVGNRIVGGAGKTPTTLAVLGHLQARGHRPGVLSRGHGRRPAPSGTRAQPLLLDVHTAPRLSAHDTGDEPWLIHRRCGVPVGIAASRAEAARALLEAHPEVDILVCDDALQHLALARDIEIVVFDERGAGNGWLLPAGLLREPIDAAPGPGVRGPALVLYNSAAASTPLAGHTVRKGLQPLQRLQDWPLPEHVVSEAPPPRFTPDTELWAVAGIAQPERFFSELRRHHPVHHTLGLPDHAPFDPLPWPPETRHVVVTEKDAVKITASALAQQAPHTHVWVAAQRFEPEPSFWRALDAKLNTLSPTPNRTPPPWTPD